MKTAVIYARFSSEKQREESIEGQIRECLKYAERNGITVIGTYEDRAISGKTDERPEFQRMIKDATDRKFECVLVYALNRFSRNPEHYYVYKGLLMSSKVELFSATEAMPEGPTAIIYEAMMVGYNAFYSAELSEKIKRGQTENAAKFKFNGGAMPLGYVADKDGHYTVEPSEAAVVLEIYTRYNDGQTMNEIITELNSRGIKTKRGNAFNKNSLYTILKNRHYLGEYIFRGTTFPGAFPAIVPTELFDEVQARMTKNKAASARKKADEPFILTTKIFCGDCGAGMIGESGTSRTGDVHYYYKCGNAKRGGKCKRKAVRKHWIEDIVIEHIMRFLFDDAQIQQVADMVMDLQEKGNPTLPLLKRELKQINKGISNLLDAIMKGGVSAAIQDRLSELEARKSEIEVSIKAEELKAKKITREQAIFWLTQFRSVDVTDIKQREKLVDLFVNAVYVYSDRLVLVFNYKEDSETVTLEEATSLKMASGSDIACCSPPNKVVDFDRKSATFFFAKMP